MSAPKLGTNAVYLPIDEAEELVDFVVALRYALVGYEERSRDASLNNAAIKGIRRLGEHVEDLAEGLAAVLGNRRTRWLVAPSEAATIEEHMRRADEPVQ